MQFLGVGYQEIGLILLLLLVVVGPERMPAVAYQIGKAVRTLQKYARAVRDEFSDEIDYIDQQYRGLKGELESASSSMRQEQATLAETLRAGQADVAGSLDDALRQASSTPKVNGNAPSPATNVSVQVESRADVPPEPAKETVDAPEGPPLVF